MPDAALAVFVKTPGHSPVKTRLAAAIGPAAAAEFYGLSLAAVAATMAAVTPTLRAYWAVAEAEAEREPLWQRFPTVSQGLGSLGARLDCVYRTLRERHDRVLLAGADAPLLSAVLLQAAVASLDAADFALCRSRDGGYALFAGRIALPSQLWTAVPYSCPQTAEVFARLLRDQGTLVELPPLDDVDTPADLERLAAASSAGLTAEQAATIAFARRVTGIGTESA